MRSTGIVYHTTRLSNPFHPDPDALAVDAVVDAGATPLRIPDHMALAK